MDTPTPAPTKNWHHEHKQKLTTGERAADRMRNGMGSWAFVLSFLAFMVVWAFLNTRPGIHHWDNFPFILLNLFLSMLAGLQGAILLIAAKRADAISAVMAAHDYETNRAAKRDIERLMEVNEKQLLILAKLQKQLESKK
jgi:uncharacterized membrane protein